MESLADRSSQGGQTEDAGGKLWEKSRVKEPQGPEKRLKDLFQTRKGQALGMVCIGTLGDLFTLPDGTVLDSDGSTMRLEFWREDGSPMFVLKNLMRGIIKLVDGFLYVGITHWKLDPCCVSITSCISFHPEEPYRLRPVLSEECLEKGLEDLRNQQHVTDEVDLVFALARLLFFCATSGKLPDSPRPSKILKISHEHIPGAMKNHHLDLTALEHVPEAMDLISSCLDVCAEYRPEEKRRKMLNSLRHPFFWADSSKFYFICEASRIINRKRGILLESLVRVASVAFCSRGSSVEEGSNEYDEDKVKSVLGEIEQDFYPCYYHSHALREFDMEYDLERHYRKAYPRLFFELYKLMRRHDEGFIAHFMHDHNY